MPQEKEKPLQQGETLFVLQQGKELWKKQGNNAFYKSFQKLEQEHEPYNFCISLSLSLYVFFFFFFTHLLGDYFFIENITFNWSLSTCTASGWDAT